MYPWAVPRYVDHSLRRAAIVDAAWRLIADEGYDAVTIRRLATELGGATGRVTNYFDTKDDILGAVLDELTASHQSGLARLSEELDAAGGDLDAITTALVESLPLDSERIRDWKSWLAFWGRASVSTQIAEQHRTIYSAWRTRLASMLEVAAGRPVGPSTERHAEQLLALIDGLGLHLLIEPSRTDRKVLFEMIYTQLTTAIVESSETSVTASTG